MDDMGNLCRNHDSPWPRLLKRVVGRKVEIVAAAMTLIETPQAIVA